MKLLHRFGLLGLLFFVSISVSAWLPSPEQKGAALVKERPTWSWDFARTGALPPGATFSRTSGAMQYLSDGTLGWAPENLQGKSETFSTWGDVNGVTANTDGTVGPFGTGLALKVLATAGAGYHYAGNGALGSLPAGTTTELWIYVKQGNTRYAWIGDAGDSLWHGAYFDFQTGTWARNDNATTFTPVDLGNGWWRLGLTFARTGASAGIGVAGWGATSAAAPNYTAAGTEYVYAFGAHQFRAPNASRTYVATSGGTAYYGPRFDFDPATKAPLGLMVENASTNLVTYSNNISAGWIAGANATVTDNAVVAPDGTTTASSMIENSATGAHGDWEFNISVTSGSYYGYSIYVKNISGSRWLQFNVSGGNYVNFQPSTGTIGTVSAGMSGATAQNVGNGWYRLWVTYTAPSTVSTTLRLYLVNASNSGGAASYTGDGTSGIALWGVQWEAAGNMSPVSSLIPTKGATATRATDSAYLGVANVPGFDATKGGVIAATARINDYGGNSTNPVFGFSDGSDTDFVAMQMTYGGGVGRDEFWRSSAQARPQRTLAVPRITTRRMSLGWSASRALSCLNGATDSTVATGAYALPTGINKMYFGQLGVSTARLTGTISNVAYWRGARSDAFVQGASR